MRRGWLVATGMLVSALMLGVVPGLPGGIGVVRAEETPPHAHDGSMKHDEVPSAQEEVVFRHAQAADTASASGDWTLSYREWRQAVAAAEQTKLPATALAVIYYEYGRAAGVTCHFDVAERYLDKSYQLDKRNDGPFYLALIELARVNLDQGKNARAADYFAQAIPLLEQIGAPQQAPAEFARVLDEYARALRKLGRDQAAEQAANRAASLRKRFPDYHSITERTPYGTHCPQR